jgi:hypothetical protein
LYSIKFSAVFPAALGTHFTQGPAQRKVHDRSTQPVLCHAMCDQDSNNLTQGQPAWRVILVQCPVGKSFESIANALPWSEAAVGTTESTIKWDDNDTSVIPTIRSNLYFVRHYALCLIPKGIWEDATVSTREKFKKGRFWEHPGASSGQPASVNGIPWEISYIESIDAIQDIGETNLSLNAISEHCESGPSPTFAVRPVLR